MNGSWFLLLPVLLPLAAALLMAFLPALEDSRRRDGFLTTSLAITLLTLVPVLLTENPRLTLFFLSDRLEMFLQADDLGKVFALVMAFLWLASGVYSLGYLAGEEHQKRYDVFYLLTLGVLMALCFSGSIVTFYMFYEAMTLLTVPLVMHEMSREAVAAGIKYLIYSVIGASLALLGVFLLSPYVTTFSFRPGGVLDPARTAGHETYLLTTAFLMLLGFGAKAGLYPLHGWLPTAHPVAPAPASAVLSGVITKAGVLGTLRLVLTFLGVDLIRGTWVQTAYMSLTMFTVFMGSLLAYREKVLKKRLAWSSVSQVSYILLGIGTLHPVGITGALLHVVCHGLIKNTLFQGAGAIIHQTGITRVDELEGIGRRMPRVMACFTVASLGLVGIPPCLGFVSKWYLAQGALEMTGTPDFFRWLAPAVLLISALLTAGYLLTICFRGFFPGRDETGALAEPAQQEPGWVMLVPMMILTGGMVLLGTFPSSMIAQFERIIASLM